MPIQPFIVESPIPAVKQVSGKTLSGQPVLSVLAKLRYRIHNGVCSSCEWVDLLEEPTFSDDDLVMEADADVFPIKFATDVVVRGTVVGGGRSKLDASLDIAGRRVDWRVFGDRVVQANDSGSIRFSEPETIDKIELGFRNSYGGRDLRAEQRANPPWRDGIDPYSVPEEDLPEHSSPFSYPRNPAGKGYVIGDDPLLAIGVSLPNIEFSDQLLTPTTLMCPDLLSWPLMPLSAGSGWVSYEWFPRSGYCNLVRPYHADLKKFAEVERGYVTKDALDPQVDSLEAGHRFVCGAPAWLQLPFLRGGEAVSCWELGGVNKRLDFSLPAAPQIWTDGRSGLLKNADVVIHSLIIDADADEIIIVWRGTAPALRLYLPEELPKMPFKVQMM